MLVKCLALLGNLDGAYFPPLGICNQFTGTLTKNLRQVKPCHSDTSD